MSTAGHLSSDIRHLSSEDDEEAAEQLHRLLAFGPRIRRGAGGRTGSETPGSGDGHEARPPGSHHRRGRRMPMGRPVLCARDDMSSRAYLWSMIFSENRYPPRIASPGASGAGFFGIMLRYFVTRGRPAAR